MSLYRWSVARLQSQLRVWLFLSCAIIRRGWTLCTICRKNQHFCILHRRAPAPARIRSIWNLNLHDNLLCRSIVICRKSSIGQEILRTRWVSGFGFSTGTVCTNVLRELLVIGGMVANGWAFAVPSCYQLKALIKLYDVGAGHTAVKWPACCKWNRTICVLCRQSRVAWL